MASKIPKSLFSLAIGGFGIGLTEFLIMGLLPEVATAFGTSIPEAGYLISAYALGVVVGAPILVLLAGSIPPKKILIGLMCLFTLFNGLSALAPDFNLLVFLRFLSGLPHGAYFGVGAVVASRIAGPEKAASAFAVMLGGLTVSIIFGLPIATFLGQHYSWRVAFGLVSVVGVLAVTGISMWIPSLKSEESGSIRDALAIFRRKELLYSIAIASIGFGGFFAWFSYITPMLLNITKVDSSIVPWFLAVAGAGMTFGNVMGGRLADRYSALPAAIYIMTSMCVVLILNVFFSSEAWAMLPLTFITGANAMAMGAPIQMMLISSSKESPSLGSSVGQAAFNIGNSLGAFLAGIPLTLGFAFTSVDWVGAGLCFTGLLIALRLRQVSSNTISTK